MTQPTLCQIGPYRYPADQPQPFPGAWLQSNGGSYYRIVEIARVKRVGDQNHYHLKVERHGRTAPVNVVIFNLKWDSRKRKVS